MPEADKPFAKAAGYLEKTHRPLNCLMFLLPLLAAYEAGQMFFPSNLLAPFKMAQVLEPFGAPGRLAAPLLILVVMLSWHIASREPWRVDGEAVGGMVAESIIGMLPLFGLLILTSRVLGPVNLSIADPGNPNVAAKVLSGIGAGIYEEFLFRLVAMGVILFIAVDVARAPKKPMILLAILFSSVLFSLCHFLSGGAFDWYRFVFRALAGAYLAIVYVARGFGVAVGTHACYNVAVTLLYPSPA